MCRLCAVSKERGGATCAGLFAGQHLHPLPFCPALHSLFIDGQCCSNRNHVREQDCRGRRAVAGRAQCREGGLHMRSPGAPSPPKIPLAIICTWCATRQRRCAPCLTVVTSVLPAGVSGRRCQRAGGQPRVEPHVPQRQPSVGEIVAEACAGWDVIWWGTCVRWELTLLAPCCPCSHVHVQGHPEVFVATFTVTALPKKLYIYKMAGPLEVAEGERRRPLGCSRLPPFLQFATRLTRLSW